MHHHKSDNQIFNLKGILDSSSRDWKYSYLRLRCHIVLRRIIWNYLCLKETLAMQMLRCWGLFEVKTGKWISMGNCVVQETARGLLPMDILFLVLSILSSPFFGWKIRNCLCTIFQKRETAMLFSLPSLRLCFDLLLCFTLLYFVCQAPVLLWLIILLYFT